MINKFKRNTFSFDGVESSEFGLWITGTGTFDAPEKDVTEIEIPGKNGVLIFDNGRYKNIDIAYPAFMPVMSAETVSGLKNFLISHSGKYYRLTDTYSPDEFRLARYRGNIQFDIKGLFQAAEMQIIFDCKPQRFLLSGEEETEVSTGTTLNNPTRFRASPWIRIYGNGALSFGTGTITVTGSPLEYIDIDCDIMEAYNDFLSCNEFVMLSGSEFPHLEPGENIVTLTAERAIIKPRWWRL